MRHLGLRSKTTIILLTTIVVMIALSYGVLQTLVLPSFAKLERKHAGRDMSRVIEAIRNDLTRLAGTAADWGKWDDTYKFTGDGNRQYIDRNLYLDAFRNIGVNVFYIFDTKGAIVFGRIYDFASGKEISDNRFLFHSFAADHPLLRHASLNSSHQGVIFTDRGLLALASQPIVRSDRTGPVRGTLLMGRFLDDAAVAAFRKQTRVDFQAWPTAHRNFPAGEREPLRQLTAAKRTRLLYTEGEAVLNVYSVLNGFDNKPVMLLKAEFPRDIAAIAGKTLQASLLGFILAGILVMLIMLAVLQRMIVGPLLDLTRHILSIGHSGDISERIDLKRSDEIGILATEFNEMLDSLAVARRRQVEPSYNSLLENSPIGLAVVKHTRFGDGIVARQLFINRTLVRMFGYPSAEALLDADISDSWVDQDQLRNADAIMNSGGELVDFEAHRRRFDGTEWWVSMNTCPIRFDGQDFTMVWHLDITERKRTEEQLRQAQKMESIGTLAGGIAHDLNNTLVPILGLSELAMDDLPEGSQERANLQYIQEAAHRGRELVGQILAFSRQDKPERKPLALHVVVEEALQLLRSTLPATIDIRQDIDKAADKVLADSTQVHQVIINLCGNAAHAMGSGPGLLRVTLDYMVLEDERRFEAFGLAAGAYAQLTVEDTGHGMDPETAKRIFDPFFTTKVVGEGTGLGLSVVHGIVTAHGGAIEVDSAPNRGTTVRILLPLLPEKHATAATADEAFAVH